MIWIVIARVLDILEKLNKASPQQIAAQVFEDLGGVPFGATVMPLVGEAREVLSPSPNLLWYMTHIMQLGFAATAVQPQEELMMLT